jgi:hypothetical protein
MTDDAPVAPAFDQYTPCSNRGLVQWFTLWALAHATEGRSLWRHSRAPGPARACVAIEK